MHTYANKLYRSRHKCWEMIFFCEPKVLDTVGGTSQHESVVHPKPQSTVITRNILSLCCNTAGRTGFCLWELKFRDLQHPTIVSRGFPVLWGDESDSWTQMLQDGLHCGAGVQFDYNDGVFTQVSRVKCLSRCLHTGMSEWSCQYRTEHDCWLFTGNWTVCVLVPL